MKWINSNEVTPDKPGNYHTNLGMTEWGNSGNAGDPELYWLNRHGGHVTKWLDESESESLYTEKDMVLFGKWMHQNCYIITPAYDWRTNEDFKKHSTEELLSLYLKTRIPSLPKI